MKAFLVAALAILAGLPSAAQQPPASLSDYIYRPPAGWTTTFGADAILLRSPVSPTGDQCLIGLSAIVASSGDLQADLNMAWARHFCQFEARRTMTFFAAPHPRWQLRSVPLRPRRSRVPVDASTTVARRPARVRLPAEHNSLTASTGRPAALPPRGHLTWARALACRSAPNHG